MKNMKKKKHHMKLTTADLVFHILNWTLLTVFLIALAYPLLYVIISSFTSGSMLNLNLIPVKTTMQGYLAVFEYDLFWSGVTNSLINTCLATLISLFVTICCAYPLSRKEFKAGGVIMALCVFTMYFSGGMIPGYLNIKNLGLLDSRFACFLPSAMNVYNMIIVRTYFMNSIPGELHEAATIDGCGQFQRLLKVVLPLSIPVIAVIALFVAASEWNSYFGPMLYLENKELYPLSLVLRQVLIENSIDSTSVVDPNTLAMMTKRRQTMKYAIIVVSSVPMIVIYPFIQKHFTKGMMIGAVKG